MRHPLRALLLISATLGLFSLQPAMAQSGNATGTWLATDVPYTPWTFQFKQDGTKLTGNIGQNGALRGPVDIYEGTVTDDAISFKAKSPDGARTITFTGTIKGDEITLYRTTENINDGSQGGKGLFGTDAAPQVSIKRGAAVAVSAALGASAHPQFFPESFTSNRLNFKGFAVDVSNVQSSPNLAAIVEGLQRQIELIDLAITDTAQKAFVKTVPLVMSDSPTGSDNAAYSGGAKMVALTTASYSPEKPVILHELMHAYHDQKVPNGFANAEIQQLYQQARTGGKFPADSYMLSSVVEYFAMMSSVYLHGSAARDPFTRQDILEKQPDCYKWLVKEFGPR